VSALAFLTKLNGMLLVFLILTVFLLKNRFSNLKQNYKYMVIGLLLFLLIVVSLNPVFLNYGIKAFGKMVDVRLAAFSQYQNTFKEAALLSVKERMITATKMIFFEYSLFYLWFRIPVELLLFVVGIYHVLRKKDLFLISIFAYLVIIPICFLPYNVIKYYYWIFPFIHIVAGVSMNLVKDIWRVERLKRLIGKLATL
jgi:hypothetical protein